MMPGTGAQPPGRPRRGMCICVSGVLNHFATGLTAEQILDEMPDLDIEDLRASIQFAPEALSG
jgi:uncharacterized protein (DUF433 family)